MDILDTWHNFAVEQKDSDLSSLRDIIAESWKRCRKLNINPHTPGINTISDAELEQRRLRKQELLSASMPHLHKLYKFISQSRTTISLTDEDGVVLESFYNSELEKMSDFPRPGTVHLESKCGTNGIGTSLATGKPLQIIGAEHWLQDNHNWFCNTVPITRHNDIIGTLNLSCPVDSGHEHSLGMVSATAYAIEREMEMNVLLKERKNLLGMQKTIIELLDTGLIVVNSECVITQNNGKAEEILKRRGDWTGLKLSDLIDTSYDFSKTVKDKVKLDNFEIPLKIDGKHTYIGFSTAFIENNSQVERMIIRIREAESIRHFANIAGGSKAIYTFSDIIGASEALEESMKIANLASKNTTNVLITGESGTGKELIAQSIHNASSRKEKPFVAINCGALSRELIQSELFGYEGGSFTGAKKNGNPGKFELADGGTLFLDEIGEMPLDAQTNLLRVLQTGNVLRIGARHPNKVDVRIIAATNKNLEQEINNKNFRKDLYYRLNVLLIVLPPLRERISDIDLLAENFLKRFTKELNYTLDGFSSEAFKALRSYSWPGNIRELENAVERAVLIAQNGKITTADLPEAIVNSGPALKPVPSNSAFPEPGNSVVNINEMESDYIKNLLSKHNGNLRAASASMGVARSTLYNKIKKYGIITDEYRVS